jgi:oxygen-independent coproporphyrinogen-3 oxidase
MPAFAERFETDPAPDPGFGIYVHWPFCRSKCPYCDFNSHVRETIDEARWRRALLAELAHAAESAPRRPVTSIFFGGGTPSLMAPATAAALLGRAGELFALAPDVEITLEANPTSAEAGRFRDFRAAGVNRLSLGVQSLDDRALAFLGRAHDAAEALAALDLARRVFPRLSLDLIYARPGQTVAQWRAELARALRLAADHLSLYTLTVEPNTGFAGAVARGALTPPAEGRVAALFDATQESCAAAGLPAYEISNHAAPGGECRHNLTYWRYGDYLGVGPGAHGRVTVAGARLATRRLRKPEAWLAAVEAAGHGAEAAEPVGQSERATECLMMGLRLAEGVHLDNFTAAVGRPLDDMVAPARVARLTAAGLLAREPARLRATARGRRLLDAVLAELIA